MLRYSMDQEGKFDSPLSQGRIDRGYENLEVRLLHAPKHEDFVRTALFGEFAHAGGLINPIEEFDNLSVDDLMAKAGDYMSGGLEQYLESDTVTFLVYGCTRAFTHEFVRTRKGAWFLQQTMRHSRMHNANMRMPEYIATNWPEHRQEMWIRCVRDAAEFYDFIVEQDTPYQDARSVLPIATETWIIGGMPLRTFLETYNYRACWMFLPEMRWIFHQMGQLLVAECPWLESKVKISCEFPDREGNHKCYYRGVENVEEVCTLPWAKEDNRIWRSKRF
jgi:hypothetical protein